MHFFLSKGGDTACLFSSLVYEASKMSLTGLCVFSVTHRSLSPRDAGPSMTSFTAWFRSRFGKDLWCSFDITVCFEIQLNSNNQPQWHCIWEFLVLRCSTKFTRQRHFPKGNFIFTEREREVLTFKAQARLRKTPESLENVSFFLSILSERRGKKERKRNLEIER